MTYMEATNTAAAKYDPAADLAARWVPSAAQHELATNLFAADETAEFVMVPLVLVNKERGWWDANVIVEHVLIGFPCRNDNTYLDAMEDAVIAARRVMGDRKGTTSYVSIDRWARVATFESA